MGRTPEVSDTPLSKKDVDRLWEEYRAYNPKPRIVKGGPLQLGTLYEAIGVEAAEAFFESHPHPEDSTPDIDTRPVFGDYTGDINY